MQWLSAPKEIIGENGKVKALACELMKLGAPDASGKPAPEPTGDAITLEVDMVIKATGQNPFAALVNAMQLKNNRGKVEVNDKSITNIAGVFAGGDCVNGGREVVDAVQAGKDGAKAILQYLAAGVKGQKLSLLSNVQNTQPSMLNIK
jgi:dihydropyrimidine dehydrogenase (NAD+) subunit PreT